MALNCEPSTIFSQQPQTNDVSSTQPLYSVNAKYVQGVGPGYWPTAGSGLTLNLTAGTALCGNSPAAVTYAGGTLTMSASQTNYVYLAPSSSCAPTSNTSALPVGAIPLAKVVTSSSAITSITDLRTWFIDPNAQGPTVRADLKPGADACAKIQNALNDLPTVAGYKRGVVDARGFAGVQTCAGGFSLSLGGTDQFTQSNVHILFGPATFVVGSMISFTSSDSSGFGTVYLKGAGTQDDSLTYIKEANGANLPAVIKIAVVESRIDDLAVDGNKANQTCGSPPCHGVWLYDSWRPSLRNVAIWNAYTNGLEVESSSATTRLSSGGHFVHVISWFAGGAAAQVKNTADIWVEDSGFESSNLGLELIDSGGRFDHNDYGANTTYGLKFSCSANVFGPGSIITDSQFGGNNQDALYINAWSGSAQCLGGIQNTIANNQFVTSGTMTANTYDGIKLSDSGYNSVVGNTFNNPNGGRTFKTAVEILGPHLTPGRDVLAGNSLEGYGTSGCTLASTTYSIGNSNCDGQVTQGRINIVNPAAALYVGPTTSSFDSLMNTYYIPNGASRFGLLNSTTLFASVEAFNQSNQSLTPTGVLGVAESSYSIASSTAAVGVEGDAYVSGSASPTVPAAGLVSYAESDTSGTLAELTGVYVLSNFKSAGTLTNNYGIHVKDQRSVANTGNWAIKTEGGQVTFLNGNVGIGTDPAVALDIASDRLRIQTAHTPASSTENCVAGSLFWDANYLYACTATNTIKRIAWTTF